MLFFRKRTPLKVVNPSDVKLKRLTLTNQQIINTPSSPEFLKSKNRVEKLEMQVVLLKQDLEGCEIVKRDLEEKLSDQKKNSSKWLREKEADNNKARNEIKLKEMEIEKLNKEVNRLKMLLDKAQGPKVSAPIAPVKSTSSSRSISSARSNTAVLVPGTKVSRPMTSSMAELRAENVKLRKLVDDLNKKMSLSAIMASNSKENFIPTNQEALLKASSPEKPVNFKHEFLDSGIIN